MNGHLYLSKAVPLSANAPEDHLGTVKEAICKHVSILYGFIKVHLFHTQRYVSHVTCLFLTTRPFEVITYRDIQLLTDLAMGPDIVKSERALNQIELLEHSMEVIELGLGAPSLKIFAAEAVICAFGRNSKCR